jgi:hypothetical protein
MQAKTSRKMDLLRALIDHPRTGADERDAAQRMYERLAAKAADEGPERWVWSPRNWCGSKYKRGEYISTTEIAKLIRADIKLAVKVAKAAAAPGSVAVHDAFAAMPAGLKFSVTSACYTFGSSIHIVVKDIPAEWGYVKEDRYGQERDVPSPALDALGAELRAIMNAYNYDNSDHMTDYIDVQFYGHVSDENGTSIGR